MIAETLRAAAREAEGNVGGVSVVKENTQYPILNTVFCVLGIQSFFASSPMSTAAPPPHAHLFPTIGNVSARGRSGLGKAASMGAWPTTLTTEAARARSARFILRSARAAARPASPNPPHLRPGLSPSVISAS